MSSHHLGKIGSAEEVDWFRVCNKEWVDIWNSMVADEVQALIDTPRVPAQILAALRAVAERAEHERSIVDESGQTQIESALGEISSLQSDLGQVMHRLTQLMGQVDFGEAAEGITTKGRAQGLSSAIAIIFYQRLSGIVLPM